LVAPTLRSLAEAVRFAQADGRTLELVAVFDRADAPTRARFAEEAAFFPCAVRDFAAGFASLGLARNFGVEAARGAHVCFADGDDLVSFNFFAALHAAARDAGDARVAFIPGTLAVFGAQTRLIHVPDLADVGALNLLSSNPFVSRICLRRDHARAVPFTDASPAAGYAFEDWRQHCDLVAAGFDLRALGEAALFYRRRDAGLNARAETQGGAISPSPLFGREVYLQRCAEDFSRWREGGVLGAATIFSRPLGDPLGTAMLTAARRLEPSLSAAVAQAPVETPFSARDKQIGAAYYTLCETLAAHDFREVAIASGALPRCGPSQLAIGFFHRHGCPRARVRESKPSGARVALSGEMRDTLALSLKLVQSYAPNASVRLDCSVFCAEFARRFGRGLGLAGDAGRLS
jgi:hypothetical protein